MSLKEGLQAMKERAALIMAGETVPSIVHDGEAVERRQVQWDDPVKPWAAIWTAARTEGLPVPDIEAI